MNVDPYEFWWAQKVVELQISAIIISVMALLFAGFFLAVWIVECIEKWRKKK